MLDTWCIFIEFKSLLGPRVFVLKHSKVVWDHFCW